MTGLSEEEMQSKNCLDQGINMEILKVTLFMIALGYATLAMIAFPFLLMRCIQYLRFIKNDEYYDYERWLNDQKEKWRR